MWMMALLLAVQAPALPECDARPLVCTLPLPERAELEALLADKREAWRIDGDALTVAARRSEPASLCCAIQGPLQPVADDLQALVIKIPDAETAIFDIRIITSERPEGEPPVHRGASAPPAPAMVEFQRGSIASHRIRSRHLGGERMIQVYVPTGLPAGSRLPVIYLGDGLNPDYVRISAAAVRDGRAQPAIIVGIENAGSTQDPSCAPRCDPRSREYLVDMPNATAEESRFENHAAFVIHEVIPLVEANYPAKRGADQRTAMGYSSGGAWALSMATRHPEAFSNAIALSLGWKPAADAARRILPSARLFLGAGRLEARFLSRTLLAAENARAAGAQVQLSTVNAGHSFENWAILFEQALRWLFPPARLG